MRYQPVVLCGFLILACGKTGKDQPSPKSSERIVDFAPSKDEDWDLVNEPNAKAIFAQAIPINQVETDLLLLGVSGLSVQDARNIDGLSGAMKQYIDTAKDEFEIRERIAKVQADVTANGMPLLNKMVAVRLPRSEVNYYDFSSNQMKWGGRYFYGDPLRLSMGYGLEFMFSNAPQFPDGLPMGEPLATALVKKMAGNRTCYPWVVFYPAQMKRIPPHRDQSFKNIVYQGPARLVILVDGSGRVFYTKVLSAS